MVAACLYEPFSRGVVALRSADPNAPLRVEQRLLSDPLDAKRMIMSVRHAEKLVARPGRAGLLRGDLSDAARQAPLKLINGTGWSGVAKADRRDRGAGRAGAAAPRRDRRRDQARAAHRRRGDNLCDVGRRDPRCERMQASIPARPAPSALADNPMAVVDPECRVYGVEGLRVADASVMPNIVSANTNMPTIMIGERVAEFMRQARN